MNALPPLPAAAPEPEVPPAPARSAAVLAQATALLAAVLAAPDAETAARRLVAEVAGHGAWGRWSRVSLGLLVDGRLRLLAVTGLDELQPQAELNQLLAGALQEALEQGQVLLCPASEAEGAALAPIALELQALRQRVGGSVAALPLAHEGQALGALGLERHDGAPLQAAELQALQHVLALAAPALLLQLRDDEPLPRRAWRRLREHWAGLQQPGKTSKRRVLIAGATLLAVLALAPLQHQVGGRARLEGAEQRVLAAPSDGFIQRAAVRPGDRAASGAVLLELTERDLQLERERWTSQLAQHETAYAAAMAKADRTQAAVAATRVEEAQAQLALVDEQLARSRLTAPFDGVVIQGDWSQQVGAPVRQGDALITLAATTGQRVVVEVDEIDIARVRPGQRGELLLSALPWGGLEIEVERIAPLAKAVEGRNVFEVQARLLDGDDRLRPGLQGRARVAVGRLPPLWVWLRPVADRARLAWWAWFG